MAQAKRNKAHRLVKLHDRRSRDLPRNAEVATIEVDDPLALEPGEKIVTLRSEYLFKNRPTRRVKMAAMAARIVAQTPPARRAHG